jgi:DNA (cytosine-5)-methyltransferase 1
MKFLSLCSGIEAASVAWHPLGFECVGVAEIEAFPCAVLAHHYPNVPNFGDISKFEEWPEEIFAEIDIIVGGPPCQSFSIAGLRKGLNDDRGNLTLTYVRIIDHADHIRLRYGRPPVICVYENVPGLLSDKTNAFGNLLGGLAGEDVQLEPSGKRWTDAGCVFGPQRAVAWRIQDAQYHQLAQRRRRVFVVASARDGFDPAAVLLEFEGVRRDTPPRRETGQVAPTIPSRSTAGGGLGTDFDGDGGVIRAVATMSGEDIAPCLIKSMSSGVGNTQDAQIIAHTLNAAFGEKQGLEDQHALGGAGLFVPSVSPTLRAGGNQTGGDRPPGTDVDTADSLIVTHSLRAEGFDASEDGTGRGTPLVPVPIGFSYKDSGNDATEDLSPTLRSLGAYDANGGSQMGVAYAFQPRIARNGRGDMGDLVNALNAQSGETGKGDAAPCVATVYSIMPQNSGRDYKARPVEVAQPIMAGGPVGGNQGGDYVQQHMAVRRLTPVECERLQGFPDDYTNIPWRKQPTAPDGPRYKSLGNSMAVPVMRWIGRRIQRQLGGEQ